MTIDLGGHHSGDPTIADARIPPSVITGLCQTADRRGLDTETWFRGTGLTRNQLDASHTRLSYRQTATILRRALRHLPPGPVGIQVGSREVLQTWGMLGFAVRSCRAGADALTVGLEFHQAAGSLLDFEIDAQADEFKLRLHERFPDAELLQFLCEEACSSVVTMIRTVFGADLTPTRIDFAYPRPTYEQAYSHFFGCPLRFDAPQTEMSFDSELLSRPIPTANPAQLSIAIEAARHLAEPGQPRPDIVAAVESVLRQNLRRPMTMAMVAERLSVSERTLQRRLVEVGQKFGEIRNRVRLQRAIVLLRETSIPITAVAAEVGFSDGREFRRAYQRWTGRVPSDERTAPTAH